jgi:CheY-like chemotaxis protein
MEAHVTQVLIADDSEVIRRVVRDMLEPAGYSVREAPDGLAGLAALRASAEPLVVLLDYQMPQLDGEGVLREVVAAGLPLTGHEYIVISAHQETFPDSFIELLRHASIRVLPKPFSKDVLIPLIEQAIERINAPVEPLPDLPDE